MAEQPIGTLTPGAPINGVKAINPQEADIRKNERYSVRQYSPSSYGGYIGDSLGWLWPSDKALIPTWGGWECDNALRVMHYTQMNALWSGAAKVWIEKVLGTPFEISGGRNKTYQWQDLFFEADFGEGYDFMMGKFLLDYLTLNRGGFIEKVSYGASDTPIRDGAKILGLNHLDAMRIYFTGNREWPYLYQSEWYGGLHKLHYTRVIRVAAQPSANTLMFGMGKSALYDSIAVANAQTLIAKMQNELLNDMPPPGIVLFNNIRPDDVEDAMKQFKYDQIRDGQNVWRAPLQLSSVDNQSPATVTFIPVRTLPEDYDFEKYMMTNVNLLALTMGLDPQDIWPLQTKAMGSGEQSRILNEKAETRGPGYILKKLERIWNTTIPRELTLTYKASNAAQDKQIADTAQSWSDMANGASYLNDNEKRQLMVNQVPAVADVIADEQGIARLFEADPKTMQQVSADDVEELSAPDEEQEDITATDEEPNDAIQDEAEEEGDAPPEEDKSIKKDIDATGRAFVNDIEAAIKDGVARSTSKASTASRIRGAIVRYGKPAFQDGLEDGGVDPNELDEEDLATIAADNVYDSSFVTDLVNEIYSESGLKGEPAYRASLWMSTLNRFYYHGTASADKNGMYKFVGEDGEKPCRTCRALKGQVHRMKDWVRKELVPGLDHDNYECGTWEPNCKHYLEKTTERAAGNWA